MEWNKKSRTGVDSQAIKSSIPGPAILKDIKLVSVYSSVRKLDTLKGKISGSEKVRWTESKGNYRPCE